MTSVEIAANPRTRNRSLELQSVYDIQEKESENPEETQREATDDEERMVVSEGRETTGSPNAGSPLNPVHLVGPFNKELNSKSAKTEMEQNYKEEEGNYDFNSCNEDNSEMPSSEESQDVDIQEVETPGESEADDFGSNSRFDSPISPSRRNKRKNFQPRNIVYQYDDSDSDNDIFSDYNFTKKVKKSPSCEAMDSMDSQQYSGVESERSDASPCRIQTSLVKNQEPITKIPSKCSVGDREQPLDLTNDWTIPAVSNEYHPNKDDISPVDLTTRKCNSWQRYSQNMEAVDLSKNNRTANGSSLNHRSFRGHVISPRFNALQTVLPRTRFPGSQQAAGPDSSGGEGVASTVDASTMRDYAESTMKELLRIYDLNDMVDSITNHVPLQNFSSGKILENMSLPSPPFSYLSMMQHMPTSEILSQHSPLATEKTSSENHTSYSTVTSGAAPSVKKVSHQSTTSQNPDESLRSKIPDNLTNFSYMSPNSVMNIQNSRDMSTILALAALGSTVATRNAPPEDVPVVFPTQSQSPVTSAPSTVLTSVNRESIQDLKKDSHPLKLHTDKTGSIDYTRFANAAECGSNYCKNVNYREHFHCLDCNSRVFVKKEEMIRHFKWHKKRDESLQHGFLRYSPMDNCSDRFTNCSHNRKQTHYHCLKEGCDKVYISTSDVQMHANYHRKDSAIIREGFQRFRATEDCGTTSCSFYGQRTTHFHCRRSGCSYNFKNKADMEKHKTYHIKDEQLNKDGFKKFMKQEHCSFQNCRFSRICNHIHCIRPGCTYVLHSSGQLYSHKRKHERRENEMAYRKYKLAQNMMKALSESGFVPSSNVPEQFMNLPGDGSLSSSPTVTSMPPLIQTSLTSATFNGAVNNRNSMDKVYTCHQENACEDLTVSGSSPQTSFTKFESVLSSFDLKPGPAFSTPDTSINVITPEAVDLTSDLCKTNDLDNKWKTFVKSYTADEFCKSSCEIMYTDHFHCSTDNCDMSFRAKDTNGIKEHIKNHETQNKITESHFITVESESSVHCLPNCSLEGTDKHYHCNWGACQVVISSTDQPFKRLDHYKVHEYAIKENSTLDYNSVEYSTAVDGTFRRKRGRPPKNRIVEFPVLSTPSNLPQAIYTSFKLPKPTTLPQQTFMATSFGPNPSHFTLAHPPPPLLMTRPLSLIASTVSPSDQYSSSVGTSTPTSPIEEGSCTVGGLPVLESSVDHDSQSSSIQQPNKITSESSSASFEKVDGFYVFPKNTSCPDHLCPYLGSHHFHCTQLRCFYVTDRSDILLLHSKDFHDNIDIMEGFMFFDRYVDCRLPNCQSNKVNRHFHCARPGCNYSFVRYSTMSIHEQKHRDKDGDDPEASQLRNKPSNSDEERSPSPKVTSSMTTITSEAAICSTTGNSEPKTTVVKATGTYYPLSAISKKSESNQKSTAGLPVLPEDTFSSDSEDQIPVTSLTSGEIEQPLTKLLQLPSLNMKNTFEGIEKHIQYGPSQSCGRPFCKLKKKDHFHCNVCNQAFSSFSRLKPHTTKHVGGPIPVPVYNSGQLSPTTSTHSSPASAQQGDEEVGSEGEDHDPGTDQHLKNNPDVDSDNKANVDTSQSTQVSEVSSMPQLLPWQPFSLTTVSGHQLLIPQGMPPPIFAVHGGATFNHQMALANQSKFAASSESFYGSPQVDYSAIKKRELTEVSRVSNRKRSNCTIPNGSNSKKMRIPNLRILKDEPVPDGYNRYRFNEDCAYIHCGYREHQTHFHCTREYCGYSFCDKTRFVQHTARHERLDTLMGGDFDQYRATINCGRPHCIYMNSTGAMVNKASHFHCKKCDFVCTDTNKVVAHRRQHMKMDSINAAGFDKYTPSQDCNMDGCNHNRKQTHYHCLECQYAVLGLSQMSAHKYRHMD
ncbi:zinc finger protein castor homolog 1-like isoform X2 [Limulus polyphemus]|uniref:Zinc finger protein castor homolog 1-like isoform X2 n=1 Tax=Limulus polyphemus TaxID=6850 RepID=A0ABM1SND4_LIMPO|nr:zinc finger protein castor homolog 1-like isoform X2 [Limulus polyphemus]